MCYNFQCHALYLHEGLDFLTQNEVVYEPPEEQGLIGCFYFRIRMFRPQKYV